MMRKTLIRIAALAVSVLPPLVAVLSCFPLWCERGGAAVLSGFTVMLLIMAAAPILRLMKRVLASPSAWVMWLCCFVIFTALSRIADEMVMISFVGMLSNVVGALLFRLAERVRVE